MLTTIVSKCLRLIIFFINAGAYRSSTCQKAERCVAADVSKRFWEIADNAELLQSLYVWISSVDVGTEALWVCFVGSMV